VKKPLIVTHYLTLWVLKSLLRKWNGEILLHPSDNCLQRRWCE